MFPLFEELKITTQTYVVHTNIMIPLEKLFSSIDCTPIRQPYKRKFDVSKEDLNDGDIIYIQHKDECKGVHRTIKRKQMLNVVTIIVKYDCKLYNVKIAQSGKIQLTGCKSIHSTIYIVALIIELLKKYGLFDLKNGAEEVICYFICVMSNVNIEIPFKIDRDRIHHFINQKTEHISILEKSVGYVGVNIKINSEQESKEDTSIDKITFKKDGSYTIDRARFADYLENCELSNKKYKKDMYNSFLVFESGKTIMSGCSSYANRKDAYEKFTRIVAEHQEELRLRENS